MLSALLQWTDDEMNEGVSTSFIFSLNFSIYFLLNNVSFGQNEAKGQRVFAYVCIELSNRNGDESLQTNIAIGTKYIAI